MWFSLVCWIVGAWTLLATVAILRQQTLRQTVRQLIQWNAAHWPRLLRVFGPAPPDADAAAADSDDDDDSDSPAEAAEPPPPSPFAPTQLRVLRQTVRPRRTAAAGNAHARTAPASAVAAPAARSASAAAAVSSSSSGSSSPSDAAAPASVPPPPPPLPPPAALDFAVELQWTAPAAALEAAQRTAVTYELHLDGAPMPADAENADGDGDAEMADAQDKVAGAAAAATLVHRFTVGPPPAAEAPCRDAAMEEDADGGDAAADSEAAFTFSPQVSRPKKRKAPSRSRSRAGRSAVARLCGGASDPSASSDALPASSADEATPATPRRTLRRGSAASSTASASAAASATAAAASGSHSCGTFEQPGFVLFNPQAADYLLTVVSAAGSYAAAAASPARPPGSQCTSAPVRFSFRLPALLYLVQTHPRTATHARQVLDGFDELLRVLTPRDELVGVEWAALAALLGKGGAGGSSSGGGSGADGGGFGGKIHRRACGVLGALVEWRSVLRELCANTALLAALQSLVDARLAHLESKRARDRPHKRARALSSSQIREDVGTATPREGASEAGWAGPPEEMAQHAQWVDSETETEECDLAAMQLAENEAAAAAAAAAAAEAPVAAEAAPQLLDPILENALWFCLSAVGLHDNRSATELNCADEPGSAPAAVSADDAAANQSSLRAFLAAGGHRLLYTLAQQSDAAWFPTYERATLTSLARIIGACMQHAQQRRVRLGVTRARVVWRCSSPRR